MTNTFLQVNAPWVSLTHDRDCSVKGTSLKVVATTKDVFTKHRDGTYNMHTGTYLKGVVIPDKFTIEHDIQIKLPYDVATNIASHK